MTLSELLVFGLIIAGVVLFNYFMQKAAQKARREKALREAEQRAQAGTRNDASDYAWGRQPTSTEPARSEEAAAYEWGQRAEAVVVTPPVEYSGAERHLGGRALSREELQAKEARSRMEAERQRRAPRPKGEARRLFATRRDLHRAVIAMTVLGPCRANEPPEPQDATRTMPGAR